MGAMAMPPEEDARNDATEPHTVAAGGSGGGRGTGGRGTAGGTDDEPDRFVRLLLRLRDLLVPRKFNVAPYVDVHRAERAADQRARALAESLRLPEDGRFVEIPPGMVESPLTSHEFDPYVEEARRAWQRASPALLLLARAGDAVVSVVAEEAWEEHELRTRFERVQPVVVITRVPRWLTALRPRLFPWRVEVRTTDPAFLKGRLGALSTWLGVGVDVVKGGRIEPLGACQAPGGEAGTVAGLLENRHGDPFLLTCAHVVGDGCECALWRASLSTIAISDEPDAAILDGKLDCFRVPGELTKRVPCATQTELFELGRGRAGVMRIGGRRLGTAGTATGATLTGRVDAPAGYVYGIGEGRLSLFPAVTIIPRRSGWRRLLGSVGHVPFSKQGDSGSWVLTAAGDRWVGMVVAGDELSGYAVAVNALELTRHVARHTGAIDGEGHTWLT